MLEKNPSAAPLLAQRLILWVQKAFRENKVPFLSSLFFGMLAYTYAFTNKLPNHDEVGQLFGKGATFDSGRFGLEILEKIFPNFSMPWIYGVMTIAIMAVAISVIMRIFSVKTALFQGLLAGCILVFPSLIGLFGYMFTSTSYAVSFLMAVLGVWFVCKLRPIPVFFGFGCLVFSVSIYQSYISVAASFLVLVLIQELLNGENVWKVLKKGIFFVLFLVISLGGYYIANQVVMNLRGIEYNDYAAASITFELSALPQGIVTAYTHFYQFLAWRTHGLVPTEFGRMVHIVLFIACFILFILWLTQKKRQNLLGTAMLLLLILILPLAINCMYLITPPWSIHTLVLYSFVAVYVLAVVMAEAVMDGEFAKKIPELLRRSCLDLAALALAVVILVNTYTANQAFLNLHLKYENAYSFYTSLMSDLRQLPEFDGQTKVALAGTYEKPDFYDYYFAPVLEIMGINGFFPDDYTNVQFLEYYLGVTIPMASEAEIQAVMETQEYLDMGVYPYHGSVKVIDDLIVVKLS